MTDLSAFQHPRFARMYERISRESERRGTAEHRDRALAGLAGRVIEIGAGNGLNFGHYEHRHRGARRRARARVATEQPLAPRTIMPEWSLQEVAD